jgi:hypothetical protein
MLPSDITLANPTLPYGGLPFSPKDKIQDMFENVLAYTVVPFKLSYEHKIMRGIAFAEEFGYPLIVKPNGGHRGIDIHLVENRPELEEVFRDQTWDYMLQQYCPFPHEFGVFYCRMPGDSAGSIVSLTRKVIPTITGNGTSTVESLVESSDAVNKKAIREAMEPKLGEVPAEGTTIQTLVGASHSRGCIFLDASALVTESLTRRMNEICTIEGFHFGRLDVRAASLSDFQNGEFRIIEINGATSEMIHVYDSRISLLEGLTILKRQWSLLFEIAHRCAGRAERIPFFKFLGLYRSFYLSTRHAVGKLW